MTTTTRKAPPRVGELTETTVTETVSRKRGPRNDARKGKNPHIRKAGVFLKIADRLDQSIHGAADGRSNEMSDWITHEVLDQARQDAVQAVSLLRGAATALDSLGEDFMPVEARQRVATPRVLEVGMVVTIRDRYKEELSQDFGKHLTVTDVNTKIVIATDDDGAHYRLQRKYVRPV